MALGAAMVAVAPPVPAITPAPVGPGGTAVDEDATYGRMVLLLDASGSMAEPAGGGQTKIASAKAALRAVVRSLPADAQVGLSVFGATVFSRGDPGACEDSQQVVEPGVDNRDQLLAAIEGYQPYGETPIPHALRQAAADLGDEGGRAIVLVSDGESTCAPDPCGVAADLAEQGIDLQIDVVGLSVSGAARDQLRCIADRGNGTYYDVGSAAELETRLTRVAQRAIRPFTLDGRPIAGGPEDDPTPVTVGDWVDQLGPEGTRAGSKSYLVERSLPGSTLRISAIGQGRPGDEGLRVEIHDADGEECDVGSAIRQIDARALVGAQAVAGADNECDGPGSYRVTVSRRLAREGNVPFGLRVAEEPAVTDPGFTSTGDDPGVRPPEVSGRPETVIGGSSFAHAAPLEPGRHSSTIVPGEAQMYRFRLDFGQSARIRVVYPAVSPAIQDLVGLFPPFTEITTYNPMRAVLEAPPGADVAASAGGAERRELLTGTAEVSREAIETKGFGGVADHSMAGDYYLSVGMGREDFSVEIPFVIELEIVGEPQSGPTYAEGATWSVADGTVLPPADAPADAPTDRSDEAESTDGATAPVVLIAAGIAGVAVLLAAVALWRRRRT